MGVLRYELEVSGSVGAPQASGEVGRGFRVSSQHEGLGHTLLWKVSHCPFIQFMRFSQQYTGVVCHSLLQWTTFCQNSPP